MMRQRIRPLDDDEDGQRDRAARHDRRQRDDPGAGRHSPAYPDARTASADATDTGADFDGNGTIDSRAPAPAHPYVRGGEYTVTLDVTAVDRGRGMRPLAIGSAPPPHPCR